MDAPMVMFASAFNCGWAAGEDRCQLVSHAALCAMTNFLFRQFYFLFHPYPFTLQQVVFSLLIRNYSHSYDTSSSTIRGSVYAWLDFCKEYIANSKPYLWTLATCNCCF